jgi:hypothetical protein
MPIVSKAFVSPDEIDSRVGRLRTEYAAHPMIRELAYKIGVDWSDDPAVFLDVKVPSGTTVEELLPFARKLQDDVLTLMRTDELGVHTYLSFKS